MDLVSRMSVDSNVPMSDSYLPTFTNPFFDMCCPIFYYSFHGPFFLFESCVMVELSGSVSCNLL